MMISVFQNITNQIQVLPPDEHAHYRDGIQERYATEYDPREKEPQSERDEALDRVHQSLLNTKNFAEGIHDEIVGQKPMIDELEDKVDKNNDELNKQNNRLRWFLGM